MAIHPPSTAPRAERASNPPASVRCRLWTNGG